MGTYSFTKEDTDQLADDIFDLLWDIEGDFYLRHLLSASKQAYKRFTKIKTK